MKKKNFLLYSVIVLIILIFSSFNLWNHLQLKKRKVAWQILEERIKKESKAFGGVSAVIIKDLNTGWQISLNKEKLFPSASLVKIPIMAAVFEALKERRLKLNQRLRLNLKDITFGSGILKDMPRGQEFSIKRLMELMIAESDNTATNMLIERLGFDYLNSCFKKLGLKDTNISRKMLDFKSRKEGRENFTTASDMAFILEEIYRKKLVRRVYSRMGLGFLKKQKIRDRIPLRLPKDTVVAHKTGLEYGICHDAGIVFRPKGNLLIVVLTRHNNRIAKPAKRFIAQIAFLAYNSY